MCKICSSPKGIFNLSLLSSVAENGNFVGVLKEFHALRTHKESYLLSFLGAAFTSEVESLITGLP